MSEHTKIHVEGYYGAEIYKERLNVLEDRKHKGLMAEDDLSIFNDEVKGIAHLLNQSAEAFVLNHPNYPFKFYADHSTKPSSVLRLCMGEYTAALLALMDTYLKKGEKVLDLGSGLGICALQAARITGKEVVMLEPLDKYRKKIQENFKLNNFKGECLPFYLVQKSVSEKELEISEDLDPWSSSLYARSEEQLSQKFKVPTLKLADLFKEFERDVIVVDLNGQEKLFLEVDRIPKSYKKIFIRITSPVVGEKLTAELVAKFHKLGYELKDMSAHSFFFNRIA